jgi:hypothetical protein
MDFASLFRRKPQPEFIYPEFVVIHLREATEQEADALEDALQPLLNSLPDTGSTGTDDEGEVRSLYIATENAHATFAHLRAFLRTHAITRKADVTLQTRIPGGASHEVTHERFALHSERAASIAAPQGDTHA